MKSLKNIEEFDHFDIELAIRIAKTTTKEKYTSSLENVLKVAFVNVILLPRLQFKAGEMIPFEAYVIKWVHSFIRGFENRPSQRLGKKSSTFPDSIVKLIIESRLPDLDKSLIDKIEAGHSLLMTIENFVGDLLEEYIAERLIPFGWFCCWGSTINSVDFCKKDGTLLQIKNSDNSENSSSKSIRDTKPIKKWSRRVSKKADSFDWDILNEIIGCDNLSEVDFKLFSVQIIESNPSCIYIDDENTLLQED